MCSQCGNDRLTGERETETCSIRPNEIEQSTVEELFHSHRQEK